MKRKTVYNRHYKGVSDITNIIYNIRKHINRNWSLGKLFTMWTSEG